MNMSLDKSSRTAGSPCRAFEFILHLFIIAQFAFAAQISANENKDKDNQSKSDLAGDTKGSFSNTSSIRSFPARSGDKAHQVQDLYQPHVNPIYIRESGVPCFNCEPVYRRESGVPCFLCRRDE
jgi:hypothetical protein